MRLSPDSQQPPSRQQFLARHWGTADSGAAAGAVARSWYKPAVPVLGPTAGHNGPCAGAKEGQGALVVTLNGSGAAGEAGFSAQRASGWTMAVGAWLEGAVKPWNSGCRLWRQRGHERRRASLSGTFGSGARLPAAEAASRTADIPSANPGGGFDRRTKPRTAGRSCQAAGRRASLFKSCRTAPTQPASAAAEL